MPLKLHITLHLLHFKFDARTSRGAMATHQVYFLSLFDDTNTELVGIGECAPLPGLSIDARTDLVQKLQDTAGWVNSQALRWEDLQEYLTADELQEWPAIRFGLETALLDLKHGATKQLFANAFSRGKQGIPINGLIWMGDRAFMQEQIRKKLKEGYTCLKLKIGSLDFATELELLEQIREVAGAGELTIRVDANGAFTPDEAFRKLEKLARYDLHSIEQPIRQGQPDKIKQLCSDAPIPIALDEELIGVHKPGLQTALLEHIQPQYIILKPTLVGGLQASADWIRMAEQRNIGWWMTSALESNIGLNAISQFTANYPVLMPQGLGTGQLYHNNIDSPLQIRQGELWYADAQWASLPKV